MAVLILLATVSFAQPDISGKYVVWNADTSNIILLKLKKDSTGYRCMYDLPFAKIMNASASNVRLRNDTLNIYLRQPIATISTIISKGQLTQMVWRQNGETVTMLSKPIIRPQTLQAPYPYVADSVEYDNADKSVHLGATFTRPKDATRKYPVAVMITGSGYEDRDETIFEHRPFAVIADYLTKNGIAVLRVDDRMMGKSKGEVKNATSADFAQDLLTSLRYLKTRSDVDTNKIGLIGHSEGGIISAIAYKEWPHFAFIISLAGAGVPGSAISLRQQTDPVKGKVNKAAFDAFYFLVQQQFVAFEKFYGNDSMALKKVEADYDNWKQQYPDSILIALNAKALTGAQYAQAIKSQFTIPWVKFFIHADPADYFKNVKCPVLALNGSNDTQVDAVQNTTAIKTALQKGGNQQITTLIFPGLNHLFQHCKTGDFKEYALIEETFSTGVLSVMGNWLRNEHLMK